MIFSSLKEKCINNILENPIYFLSLFWVFIIFSSHSYVWYINYGVFNIPLLESIMGFSDASSWLAVASEISRGTLFPTTPSLENKSVGIMHFPYFSLWIYGFFIYIFGSTISLLLLQIILPLLIFILMMKIYRIYLSFLWSLSLTSLSLISYSNIDFRVFLLKILNGDGWNNFIIGEQLGVASTPFPSFSLLFFLLAFYLTVNNKKFLSNFRITFLTTLWSIQVYCHLINALIGIPFWFITLFIWLNRDRRNYDCMTVLKKIVFQILITLLIISPFIISIIEFINFQNLSSSFGLVSESTFNHVPNYIFIANFAFPLLLLVTAYYFFKVDKFELIVKFLPFFLLMLIELFFLILKIFTGIGLDINLIFNRIGTPFLHIFYFVPSLYYLSRDIYFKSEYRNNYRIRLQKLINQIFNYGSNFYLPILLILLTLFSFASLNKYNSRLKEARLEMKTEQKVIETATRITKSNETIVSDKLKTNFVFTSIKPFGNLLVNRSVNKISLFECVDRLLLWGKIRNLKKSDFIQFMSPIKKSSLLVKSYMLTNEELAGIGYWICLGKTFLNKDLSTKYNTLINNAFDNFNFDSSIEKFNVNTIIVNNNSTFFKNFTKIKSFENTHIYKLNKVQ